uniref:Uncharacterized protein n=1 Tax=Rhizophora mucronata TaxID=61149 RepID=A0A2P2QSC7_RHIMU
MGLCTRFCKLGKICHDGLFPLLRSSLGLFHSLSKLITFPPF